MSDRFRDMIDDLCDVTEGLTNWECDFVSDMKDWVGEFTERQKEVIERIWNQVM